METVIDFRPIDKEAAEKLATWRYQPPLDFYNHAETPEYYLDPENRYFIVYQNNKILGFYCSGYECRVPGGNYKEEALDIGIGLNPDFVGQGFGRFFLRAL